MNYKKLHDNIISKYGYKEKPETVYTERHHIVPKCIGGSDEKDNLVYLEARVHLLIHWILTRIYPNSHKIIHAFFMMCFCSNRKMKRTIPSLVVLAEARKRKSEQQSNLLKGSKLQFCSEEAIEKRIQTAMANGSYRGLNNPKSKSVDVYNYFTGELVASNVSVTEWGRENNVKRNLNTTLYADRNKKSSSMNRHHAKGFYIVLHGDPPYPPKGGEYKGPYSNQGHIGLKKGPYTKDKKNGR